MLCGSYKINSDVGKAFRRSVLNLISAKQDIEEATNVMPWWLYALRTLITGIVGAIFT